MSVEEGFASTPPAPAPAPTPTPVAPTSVSTSALQDVTNAVTKAKADIAKAEIVVDTKVAAVAADTGNFVKDHPLLTLVIAVVIVALILWKVL